MPSSALRVLAADAAQPLRGFPGRFFERHGKFLVFNIKRNHMKMKTAVLSLLGLGLTLYAGQQSPSPSQISSAQSISGHVSEEKMLRTNVVSEIERLITKLEKAKNLAGDQSQAKQEEIRRLRLVADYNHEKSKVYASTLKGTKEGVRHIIRMIDAKMKYQSYTSFPYYGEFARVQAGGETFAYVSNDDLQNIMQLAINALMQRNSVLTMREQLVAILSLKDPSAMSDALRDINRNAISADPMMNGDESEKYAKLLVGDFGSDTQTGTVAGAMNTGSTNNMSGYGGVMEEPFERVIKLKKGTRLSRYVQVANITDSKIIFTILK